MSTPSVSIQEASGVPPLPDAGIRSRVAMIAPSTAGTDAAKPIYSLADLAEFGQGVLKRHGSHLFAETKTPFLAIRCGATNPGTYDTIDNSAVNGTAIPATVAAFVPTDEAELYIKIVTGGTLGVSGIEYRRSDSYGREGDSEMPLRALGTATSITFADVNAKIEFDPPLAALLTYVNELVDDAEAHFAEGVTIHGAADAGPYTISATAASQAAAIVRFNEALAAAKLHVVKTSSSIHGAADNTALAALNAITTPTTGQTLLTAAIAFEAAFFGDGATVNSGHTQRTASSVHGSQDGTNTIASEADRGELLTGDIIRCGTNAPTPNTSDLTAAIGKLADSSSTPAILLLPGRTSDSLMLTLKAGLDTLRDIGKPVVALVQARQASSETYQQHVDNVETEWLARGFDNRISVVCGDYLATFNDGSKLRQRAAGIATHTAVRHVKTEFFRAIWYTDQLDKVSILDAAGAVIGWDEQNTPAKPRKVQVFYRVPRGNRPFAPTFDFTLFDPDNDRTTTVRERRVTDDLSRVVREWSFDQVAALAATTRIPNTNTGRLKESVRRSFQQSLAALIATQLGGTVPDCAIVDTDLPDLVAIDPIVSISGAIVSLSVVINYQIIEAVGRIKTTLSAQGGS